MNDKFDELTKQMAQSVTRRGALKKFGIGLAGMALACFGLAGKAQAASHTGYCMVWGDGPGHDGKWLLNGYCFDTTTCQSGASKHCSGAVKSKNIGANPCDFFWPLATNKPCSF